MSALLAEVGTRRMSPYFPDSWRQVREILVYPAALLLRLNLFLALPLVLIFYLVQRQQGFAALRVPIAAFALTNSVGLVVALFFIFLWRWLYVEGVAAWLLLGLFILPSLGALGVFVARQTLQPFFPGLVSGPAHLMALFAIPVALLYGLSLHSGEEFRRRLGSTLAALDASRQSAAELTRAKDRAELAALRAFVQPHFLFNTLNAIAALIPSDPPRAEAMTLRLARLLRRLLDRQASEWIPLGEEAALLTDYLEIEKTRMGERLTYAVEIPEELAGRSIPTLLLQPLVENAVKHGVLRRGTSGSLRVQALAAAGGCEIEVRDNGPGPRPGSASGHGLKLVRDRLAAAYGRDDLFSLTRDDARGETVATVLLPAASARSQE